MLGKALTAVAIGLLGLLLAFYAVDLFREAMAERRAAAESAPAGSPAPASPPPAAQHVPIQMDQQGGDSEPVDEGEGGPLDDQPVVEE